MSMDKVWLCPSIDRKTWSERGQMEKAEQTEEFRRDYERLHGLGNYVTLSHGGQVAIDEIYLFTSETDAKEFYSTGCLNRQYVNDGKGLGFQEVVLFLSGAKADSKDVKGE